MQLWPLERWAGEEKWPRKKVFFPPLKSPTYGDGSKRLLSYHSSSKVGWSDFVTGPTLHLLERGPGWKLLHKNKWRPHRCLLTRWKGLFGALSLSPSSCLLYGEEEPCWNVLNKAFEDQGKRVLLMARYFFEVFCATVSTDAVFSFVMPLSWVAKELSFPLLTYCY